MNTPVPPCGAPRRSSTVEEITEIKTDLDTDIKTQTGGTSSSGLNSHKTCHSLGEPYFESGAWTVNFKYYRSKATYRYRGNTEISRILVVSKWIQIRLACVSREKDTQKAMEMVKELSGYNVDKIASELKPDIVPKGINYKN